MEIFDMADKFAAFIISKHRLILLVVGIIVGITYFIVRKIKSVGTCPYCKEKLKEKIEFTESINNATGKGAKSVKHTVVACTNKDCKFELVSDEDIKIKINDKISSIKLNKTQLLDLAAKHYIKIKQYHIHSNGKSVPYDAVFTLPTVEGRDSIVSYSYKVHGEIKDLTVKPCICCGSTVVEESMFFKCTSCDMKLNKVDFALADHNISTKGNIGAELVTKGYYKLAGQTDDYIYLVPNYENKFYVIKKDDKEEAMKNHCINNEKKQIESFKCRYCDGDVVIENDEYICKKCGITIKKNKQIVEIVENKDIEIELNDEKIQEYLKKGYFKEEVNYSKEHPFFSKKGIIVEYNYEAVLTMVEKDKQLKITRVGKIDDLYVCKCNKCDTGNIYEYCNSFSCDNPKCDSPLYKTDVYFAENRLSSINKEDVRIYIECDSPKEKLDDYKYTYFKKKLNY